MFSVKQLIFSQKLIFSLNYGFYKNGHQKPMKTLGVGLYFSSGRNLIFMVNAVILWKISISRKMNPRKPGKLKIMQHVKSSNTHRDAKMLVCMISLKINEIHPKPCEFTQLLMISYFLVKKSHFDARSAQGGLCTSYSNSFCK